MKEYLALIMSLMYVARLSRPDILLAITFVATHSNRANEADLSEAKRVLRYLRDTYLRADVYLTGIGANL
jgi:hypothetical protein